MKREPPEDILGIRPRRDQHPTLLPLGTPDHGHRITTNAFKALRHHYHCQSEELARIIQRELAPLIPIARTAYEHDRRLVTSYDFTAKDHHHVLAYEPNDYGGITIMLGNEPSR